MSDMHTSPAPCAQAEHEQTERARIKANVLAVLARRPHPHTELVGIIRAMTFGAFSIYRLNTLSTFKAMDRQKARIVLALRSMSAEGEIAETSTLATTTYSLPKVTS